MTRWQQIRLVAGWEFRRFFKWKEQLVGLLLLLLGGAAGLGLVRWMESRGERPVELCTAGELPGAAELAQAGFVLRPVADLEAGRAAVRAGETEGLLHFAGAADGDFGEGNSEPGYVLETRRSAAFEGRLAAALAAAALPERLERVGLDLVSYAALSTPPPLTSISLDPRSPPQSPATRAVAVVLVVLVLVGVISGNAYLFLGITGEKQLRITEQVLAAISPQTWVDGKVLGVAGLSLVSVGIYVLAGGLGLWGAGVLGYEVGLSPGALNPVLLLQVGLLAGLGFGFWLCVFAAIAATIDDPNHSARSAWMMLPGLPLSAAFAALADPQGTLFAFLALFPPSASAVLPVRLVLGVAEPYEVPLAAALLVGAIWITRRAAGRVFALGIEMRGKEPSWGEIIAAARRAKQRERA